MVSLISPRVIVALLSLVLFGAVLFWVQHMKTRIATLEGEKARLEQINKDLGGQFTAMERVVATLKANLQAARKSVQEMQAIREEANELRRRIIELQNRPGACDFLKVEYEKLASDITGVFNNGVRRKIDRPAGTGN